MSAYRADSHAAWADVLSTTQGDFRWRVLELPGRYFSWRIRGNPLSWLDSLPSETPDRIVASSMVDLATLKGLNPRLAAVPSLYYFHENQFAYPAGEGQHRSLEPRMVQLYGALAAERLVFNSRFNRDTFLCGVDRLLTEMPDAVPAGVAQRLAGKSVILPVAIRPIVGEASDERDAALVVWNHRWEHDRQPALFAEAMVRLAEEGIPFRLALLGRRPDRAPEPLSLLRRRLPDRIVADAMLPRDAYRKLLSRAGIVVSTTRHEFQGLSVLEAASAGARPLVPDALCYPELYPAAYRYPADDVDALLARLREWLSHGLPPPVDVSCWSLDHLKPAWKTLLQEFA